MADCSLVIPIDTGKSFPADTPIPPPSLTADAVTVPLSESLPHTFPGTPAASFPDTKGLRPASGYAATSCDMQTALRTNRLPAVSPESPATQSAIRFRSSGTNPEHEAVPTRLRNRIPSHFRTQSLPILLRPAPQGRK